MAIGMAQMKLAARERAAATEQADPGLRRELARSAHDRAWVAIAKFPENERKKLALAYWILGTSGDDAGSSPAERVAALTRAIELLPELGSHQEEAEVRFALAAELVRCHQPIEALGHAREAFRVQQAAGIDATHRLQEIECGAFGIEVAEARATWDRGDAATAVQLLEQVLAQCEGQSHLDRVRITAERQLAYVLGQSGNIERSLEIMASTGRHEDPMALVTQSSALFRAGQPDEALELI